MPIRVKCLAAEIRQASTVMPRFPEAACWTRLNKGSVVSGGCLKVPRGHSVEGSARPWWQLALPALGACRRRMESCLQWLSNIAHPDPRFLQAPISHPKTYIKPKPTSLPLQGRVQQSTLLLDSGETVVVVVVVVVVVAVLLQYVRGSRTSGSQQ